MKKANVNNSLKEGAELVISHVIEYSAWAGQFALHSL